MSDFSIMSADAVHKVIEASSNEETSRGWGDDDLPVLSQIRKKNILLRQ